VAANLPGGAAPRACDLGYRRHHGARNLLPRRQRRQIRPRNALLPVDTILLEVVAPFREGTAAGRFIERTGGRGGYMAIFCCDDPDARGKHANAIGVRTANVITHAPYRGVQLHPRDCRAAFIEFNHTDAATMFWGPIHRPVRTGRKSIRNGCHAGPDRGRDASPDPQVLARALGQHPRHTRQSGRARRSRIEAANGVFRFVRGDSEIMSGLTFEVADIARVRDCREGAGLRGGGRQFSARRGHVQSCGVIGSTWLLSQCVASSPLPLWERVDAMRSIADG